MQLYSMYFEVKKIKEARGFRAMPGNPLATRLQARDGIMSCEWVSWPVHCEPFLAHFECYS